MLKISLILKTSSENRNRALKPTTEERPSDGVQYGALQKFALEYFQKRGSIVQGGAEPQTLRLEDDIILRNQPLRTDKMTFSKRY